MIVRIREEIEPIAAGGRTAVEMLGHAHAEQARIGEEDVGGEAAIIAVQEIAGDRGGIEHVLDVAHDLPAGRIGEDHSEVEVGVTVDAVIRIVVEDARPGCGLPIEIAVQGCGPIRRDRYRIIRPNRHGVMRRVG